MRPRDVVARRHSPERAGLRPSARAAARALTVVALAAALVGALPILPAGAQEPAEPWVGRPLAEAMEDLLDRGLRLVYSSDLIRPEMRVLVEPTASAMQVRLEQLLEPHGLTVQVGPAGHLLVVRRARPPLEVRLVSPRPGDVTVGEVEVEAMVLGEEPVDRLEVLVDDETRAELSSPPWRTTLLLSGDATEWRIAALAHGRWGGVDRATVTTRNVVFRDQVQVALREVYVTVADRGDWAGELEPEHFRVIDGGVEIRPSSLDRVRVPLIAAVLIDTSQSMQGRALEAAVAGAETFLQELSAGDEAMVMLFSDRVRAMTPFARGRRRLPADFEGTTADGGTALNDHLYAALRLLDTGRGWPVVVLLSDGADVLSALTMEEVRWKIASSDAAIYWLRIGSRERSQRQRVSSAWRDAAGNQLELEELEQAVRESGGSVIDLAGSREVAGAFETVVEELREQYVLSYAPPPVAGADSSAAAREASPLSPGPVTVRSTLPHLRLRSLASGLLDRASWDR
ncbi:MAG TPA: VWA domain-containing protein [Thermoanaerobaculia bacterium]|nr:VWA domain-containing protein [Thermoanaerobaculia bacterium]